MLGATMAAAVLTGHGGPDRLDVRRDVPVPAPRPGEVLVRVHAAGVNNTDVWTREGAYGTPTDPEAVAGWRGEPLAFPRIQGGDIAGTVASVGDGEPTDRVGERVLVDPAIYDRADDDATPVGLLGSERDGGFAEFVAVPTERAHAVDASPLSDEELAALPIAYGTALGMLERGEVRAGERVLVTGASGGVGLASVQLARARGCEVVAVTASDKAAAVAAAGAHHTVARTIPDVAAEVVRATGGPVDAILDVVGGPLLTGLLAALREGGRAMVAGAVAGPVVELDLRTVYLRQRRLIGSSLHTPRHFARLVDLVRAGEIRPRVAAVEPLERIHAVQHRLLKRRHVGKLVLVPSRGGHTPP